MNIINLVCDTFKSVINYETVNSLSKHIKLRQSKNGITLTDVISYRFLYTDSNDRMTKQAITCKLNSINNTSFTRQAYDSKDKNVPLEFYEFMFLKFKSLFRKQMEIKDDILVAVDGTYNTSIDRKPMLNLGLFDISNGVPLDIQYYGNSKRNQEVSVFMDHIKNNIDKYRNVIFVADRGYYNYNLINFIQENNLNYIIRIKGDGKNLNPKTKINKNVPKYLLINNIKNNSRLIKSHRYLDKKVNISKSKTSKRTALIKIRNDCVILTNLKDKNKYSDQKILDLYNSRWDIEVFFKYIKHNFKFRNLDEKDIQQHKKLYYCELIIMYIVKMLETEIAKKDKLSKNKKINKTLLITGLYDGLLVDMISNSINESSYTMIRKYVMTYNTQIGRHNPRKSKTPFTRWYVKDYSESSKYSKVINAILDKKTNELNKNLKTLSKRIKIVKIIENG